MLLDSISGPQDLQGRTYEELDDLCEQIRDYIVAAVSEHGGHLGSNLGDVELTVALHRVFRSPHDAILWDTGTPGIRAQDPHRTSSRIQEPPRAWGFVGISLPCGIRSRLDRELPRLDGALLRLRFGHGLPPPR